jgi:hypothetical protein
VAGGVAVCVLADIFGSGSGIRRMGEALGHYMWEAICPCFFPQRDSAIFRACEV